MADDYYAIVVGINDYPGLRSLAGPVNDARLVRKWLLNGGGVPKANLKLITVKKCDPNDPRPIVHDINKAFEEIYTATQWQPAKRLYIYFAGHGCALEIDHVLLMMANATIRTLGEGVNAHDYENGLGKLALFEEQIFFYDCCRNYDSHARMGYSHPWSEQPPGGGAANVQQYALYAAGFTEFAHERKELLDVKRGLFTRALLEGLEGAAARTDGAVTSSALTAYVNRRVARFAKDETPPLAQRVRPARVPATDIVLAAGVQQWLTDVTVVCPPGTQSVTARDSSLRPVETKQPANGSVVFRLSSDIYSMLVEPGRRVANVDVQPREPVTVEVPA